MTQSDEARALDRLRAMGILFSEAEWRALPEPARRRLTRLPHGTEVEKRCLAELARWAHRTFPPGWSRRGE